MTDCNTNQLLFASLGRKKIQADFNGGSLTSDAGALLLRELDRRMGLVEAMNHCIPDPRNPFYTIHQQRTMLAQRIFGIALGGACPELPCEGKTSTTIRVYAKTRCSRSFPSAA